MCCIYIPISEQIKQIRNNVLISDFVTTEQIQLFSPVCIVYGLLLTAAICLQCRNESGVCLFIWLSLGAELLFISYRIKAERYGYIPREKKSALCYICWESWWAFSAECLHMLHALHMRAAGWKQGGSCSQRSSLHAVSVSGALRFACVKPNSFSIKTPLSVSHELPHFTRATF